MLLPIRVDSAGRLPDDTVNGAPALLINITDTLGDGIIGLVTEVDPTANLNIGIAPTISDANGATVNADAFNTTLLDLNNIVITGPDGNTPAFVLAAPDD